MRSHQRRRASATALAAIAVAVLSASSASGADEGPRRKKPVRPVPQVAGPAATSQDFGDVVVLVDNGLMVTPRNPFDLSFVTTLRFEPAGAGKFTVARSSGGLDTSFGTELTFGYPAATLWPGDDDTQEVAFSAGFPFHGTTYPTVWVNTDGNITFGAPEFASNDRDKAKHVLGPPRVSAFLHDWNPLNALNPAGNGSIHAVAKADPARLVVTWNGVADFEGGVSNTFQIKLFATGAIEITLVDIETPSGNGVVGIAKGAGQTPFLNVDFSSQPAGQALDGGAIMEAFSTKTFIHHPQITREFYRSHPDKFDFVTLLTDFGIANPHQGLIVKNDTHGIGARLDPANGQPYTYTGNGIFDFTAGWGSAGELEQVICMNNVNLMPPVGQSLTDPPVQPYKDTSNVIRWYEYIGQPVTLDGQKMSQIRDCGSLPEIDFGDFGEQFDHGGNYSLRLFDHMVLMAHETQHRWGVNFRFVHPTKGTGFDSYDLLGREIQHWSLFMNSTVPASQFGGAPRSSVIEGSTITDLGAITSYKGSPVTLASGERVFEVASNALVDGYNELDQYAMGLRRAADVSPFWYVDEPVSIYTGASLDPFDPSNPLNPLVTMRGWTPMGGIAFKGKRVDLTIKNIQDWEAIREGKENPKGKRFWGPKGNLKVRYVGSTGLVDPAGDKEVTLSESDRELGDEADKIDSSGKPVDVKTMAFVLVVKDGSPAAHSTAIAQVDALRRAFQEYANGPATGGRGKFDTSLNPVTH